MDTKLKNSKFNPIIKTIILILTLIFAFLSGTSALDLVRKTFYFNHETEDIRNTPVFVQNIQNELNFLSWEASRLDYFGQNMTFDDYSKNTSAAKDLKESYENELNEALYYYNQIQEHKKIQPLPDGTSYDSDTGCFYITIGDYDSEFGTIEAFQSALSEDGYFGSIIKTQVQDETTLPATTFVVGNPDTAYTAQNTYNTRAEWEYDYANLRTRLFAIVNDARSEETIKKELEIKYNEQLVLYYEDEQEYLYNLRSNFNNIDFLILNNKNGNYISNFEKTEDIENLKKNYKENAFYYFYFDGKKLSCTPIDFELEKNFINMILLNSGLISENVDTRYLIEFFKDCTVYIKVNTPQVMSFLFFRKCLTIAQSKSQTLYKRKLSFFLF